MPTTDTKHVPPSPAPVPAPAWQPSAVIRLVPVLAAVFSVLLGGPDPLNAALWLLAVVVVAERLARIRALGVIDTILVAVGGVLVSLILTGLLLGVSRIGLQPRQWAVALGGLAVLGLALGEWLAPASRRRGPARVSLPLWPTMLGALATAAVVVMALVVSVRATDTADVAPVQMSFAEIETTSATVLISSDRATGSLELRTQASDGTSLSYPLFSVDPGSPVTRSVVLPQNGRFVITLNNPDQSAPLRSLILDR